MESPSANLEHGANNGLEDTIELPILKLAARNSVDIYLPKPLEQWSGPALQEPSFVDDDDLSELSIPPRGMLRAVETAFSESTVKSSSTPNIYARRSAKYGFIYTLIFVAVLAAGTTWLFLNFDTLLAGLFKGFV